MSRHIAISIFIIAMFFCSGCGEVGLGEPPGTPVSLTQEDLNSNKWSKESYRMWTIWHLKGIRLAKSGKYEEALYCFNQAMKAWPKKDDTSKTRHFMNPVIQSYRKQIFI